MINLEGIAASPGIKIGTAYLLLDQEIIIQEQKITDSEIESEIDRLHQALESVKQELSELKEYMSEKIGHQNAGIFKAHLMFLNDPELVPKFEEKIKKEQLRAEKAVAEVMDNYIQLFSQMKDDYLKARKSDVSDVRKRIIEKLIDRQPTQVVQENDTEEGIIVVASDLTPSDTAQLDRSVVKAFVTEQGSRTSHSAIMARSLGIPAVVGLGEGLLEQCNHGDKIIVDGVKGKIYINPDLELLKRYQKKAGDYKEEQQELTVYRDRLAETKDGKRIEVMGNIGEPADVNSVLENGGEGIGLFRTEFLYMNRDHLPSEEEQFQVYCEVAKKMKQHPVIIRTLDIGGGKDLPYLDLDEEQNPFLGYRAIRISLEKTEIFKAQLKAVLRAGSYGNIKLMYPMISSLEELNKANQVLAAAKEELRQEGKDFDQDMEIGIMIEIPATLMIADILAKNVDFFSIGTNDLIQYMLAVDRNNEKIADMHSPYHPAVLRFIKQIIDIAHKQDIWVGMCGEAAGEELLLPFWLGAGIDELSMSAVSILKTKESISRWDLTRAQEISKKVLELGTEKEIIELLEQVKGGGPIN